MKLSARETFLLMLVLAVALCVGYYNYVYVPIVVDIEAGEAELMRLESEYGRLRIWEAEAPQTEERIAEIQSELDGWVQVAEAVSDTPKVLVFIQQQSERLNITVSSVGLSRGRASLEFSAPNYVQTRLFLQELERMIAFEVTRSRLTVATGATQIDGAFDIELHIGPADPTMTLEPSDRLNPFVR